MNENTGRIKHANVILLIWLLIILGMLLNIGMAGILRTRLYSFSKQNEKFFNISNRLHAFLNGLGDIKKTIRIDMERLLNLDGSVEETTMSKDAFDDIVSQIIRSGYSDEFRVELDELKKNFGALERLIADASDWRQRYVPVFNDIKNGEILSKVRGLINQAQYSITSIEGKARLQQSILLRKYRSANDDQASKIADEYFRYLQTMPTVKLLDIKSELSDLALFIERLIGESNIDHLIDLKDNNIKQAIDRLERVDAVFEGEEIESGVELKEWVKELEVLILGKGYSIRNDIQTVVIGEGGLYQLYWDHLDLINQRGLLEDSVNTQIGVIEENSLVLARKVEAISDSLAEANQHLLAKTWNNILFIAVLFMIIFAIISWQVAIFIRRQMSKQEEAADEINAILEGAGDAMRVVDTDFNVLKLNHQMEFLLGASKEEVVGTKCSDFFFSEDCEGDGCTLKRILNGEEHVELETIKTTKQGKKIPVEVIATPYRIHGEIVGMIESFRDSTKRKKMEEILRTVNKEIKERNISLEHAQIEIEKASQNLELKVMERTEELTILNEISNTIPYTSDFQQLLELVAGFLLKIIDYDVCAVLLFDGEAVNIFLKPVYPQSVNYVDQTKERLFQEASVFRNKNTRDARIHVNVLPVDPDSFPEATRPFDELKSFFFVPLLIGGEIVGMISVASVRENIFTEDKARFINTVANQVSNAIERLQTIASVEKSKIRSMIDGMLEGAVMLDKKDDIVVLNPRAREMLDLSPQGHVTSADLFAQMKLVNLDIILEECKRENKMVWQEIVTPHDERRILHCTILPVRSNDERIGTAIIFRDITREKEIDSMKTEFISTVSHELRTPLSITKEGLSLVLDRVAGDITQKQEMVLSAAKENMDRLERLINDILDISKIEANKMVIKKECLDIVQLAEYVASTFEMKAKEKGLDLRVCFSDQRIDVFADRDKIIQVFTNLINNAIKFTPSGRIEISGKADGDHVECMVADTGIGISQENLGRTFLKFQQFGRVPGTGEKGTGLGLSIAKGIVEMHHGKIWVESELNGGTKFIFTLLKYIPGLHLKEYVADGIRTAKASDASMSLMAVMLSDKSNSMEPFSKDQQTDYLNDIETILKNDLHREGDTVFRDSKQCFLTLMNCRKEHVGKVCDRLTEILHAYLNDKQLTDKIALTVKWATYPDDASDSDELIGKVNYA